MPPAESPKKTPGRETRAKKAASPPTSPGAAGKGECGICCEDGFEPSEMYAMSCGHRFCTDCWGGFVYNKLTEGPSCVYAMCPQSGCGEVVTSVEVRDVGGDAKAWEKYELRSFVDLNKKMR